ncbi:MAG: hypothetical protein HN368_23880, partial [Spirochaetales bacterium]|nr:hypothetical protein [Spirochaetales bacterium]
PPSNYRGRSELGERELLALILQNRISSLERVKRYAEAVGLAVDRYALAPDEQTRGFLALESINYAALLNEKREYEPAINFLLAAIERHGWAEGYSKILGILYYNTVVALIQSNQPRDALAQIDAALLSGWMNDPAAADLRNQTSERILASELSALSPSQGIELVDNLLADGLMTRNRYMDFAVMLYSRTADAEAQAGDYLAAARVIDGAIAKIGADSRLLRAGSAYRYNFAVEAHNAFAALYNDKKYEIALAHLLQSLEIAPESSILKDDLSVVRRALASND